MSQRFQYTLGKGDMMKSVVKMENGKERPKAMGLRLFMGLFVLIVATLLANGCRYPARGAAWVDDKIEDAVYLGEGDEFARPGMTEAEVRRRYKRLERLNNQMMLSDLDMVLMLDQPSGLTRMRIP